MKRCYACGKEKPDEEFNFSNRETGERQGMCRSCCSEYNRKRYELTREKTRQRVKMYRESNPKQVFETRLKTYGKNPTAGNLYKLVHAAEKAGEIVRPDTCQVCGRRPEKRLEAHHEDYSRPLDIIWCCTACHDRLDQERRRREGKPYHSRVRAVRCVESGAVYPSVAQAARETGIHRGALQQCLAGISRTSGGFHWEYADGK